MDQSYPVLFLIAFALVTGTAVVGAASVSEAAFGTYNPSWDGTAEVRSLAQESGTTVDIIREPDAYRETAADGTVVLVLAPDSPYDPAEAAAVREFVRRGGTVVVAGDFGDAPNQLLADLGVHARFDGRLVRDEQQYTRSPALPLATNATRHAYTLGVDGLSLNHATVLRASGSNATHLVRTSPYAYLDTNRNGELDDTETLQRHTVVAVSDAGDGEVVAVSDPSVFINAMLDEEGNRRFARNLLDTHDRLAIDVSRTDGLPPVAWAVVTVRESRLVQFLGGLALVVVIPARRRIARRLATLAGRFVPSPVESPTFDREAVVAGLRQRHPDWDEERIERIAQSLMPGEEDR